MAGHSLSLTGLHVRQFPWKNPFSVLKDFRFAINHLWKCERPVEVDERAATMNGAEVDRTKRSISKAVTSNIQRRPTTFNELKANFSRSANKRELNIQYSDVWYVPGHTVPCYQCFSIIRKWKWENCFFFHHFFQFAFSTHPHTCRSHSVLGSNFQSYPDCNVRFSPILINDSIVRWTDFVGSIVVVVVIQKWLTYSMLCSC